MYLYSYINISVYMYFCIYICMYVYIVINLKFYTRRVSERKNNNYIYICIYMYVCRNIDVTILMHIGFNIHL